MTLNQKAWAQPSKRLSKPESRYFCTLFHSDGPPARICEPPWPHKGLLQKAKGRHIKVSDPGRKYVEYGWKRLYPRHSRQVKSYCAYRTAASSKDNTRWNTILIAIIETCGAKQMMLSPMVVFKGAAHYKGWHIKAKDERYAYFT